MGQVDGFTEKSWESLQAGLEKRGVWVMSYKEESSI